MIRLKVGNKEVEFKRNFTETDESYYGRYWFVEQLVPSDMREYQKMVMYSNIWISVKTLGCRYPSQTENAVNALIKNIKSNSNYRAFIANKIKK